MALENQATHDLSGESTGYPTVSNENWLAPGFSAGIPQGAVIEIFGHHREQWLDEFLKWNPKTQLFCSNKKTLQGYAENDPFDIVSQNITFGSIKNLDAVTIRHLIQSRKYEIILTENIFTDLRIFQTLQIFAKKAKCTLVLLGGERKGRPLPIFLQLDITKTADGGWQIGRKEFQR